MTLAPKRRLKLDVLGITQLDVSGPTTPNVALLMASLDQTPPAREIVMLTVRLFGERLFRHPNKQLLKGYALAGPIPTAETMLPMDHPAVLAGGRHPLSVDS